MKGFTAEKFCVNFLSVNFLSGISQFTCGIDPAEPGEERLHARRDVLVRQERNDDVVDEKGQPAGDKTAHHDRQRARGLVLALHRRDPRGQTLLARAPRMVNCLPTAGCSLL